MNMLPLEDIPSLPNFRFIGICESGSEIECINLHVNGLSFIRSDDAINEPVWHLLKGWRHRTEADE